MLLDLIKKRLLEDDLKISNIEKHTFGIPEYNSDTYYKDISSCNYFYTSIQGLPLDYGQPQRCPEETTVNFKSALPRVCRGVFPPW